MIATASLPRSTVPCGDCSRCCQGDVIMLLPDMGDDVASYDHEVITVPGAGLGPVLKKIDGHCVYLVGGRCSIWERAPTICKVFDCRKWFQSKSRTERRQMVKSGMASADVFEAGRERLHTLGAAP